MLRETERASGTETKLPNGNWMGAARTWPIPENDADTAIEGATGVD